MGNLLSETPAANALPKEIGDMVLAEIVPEAITWFAPFQGHDADVASEFQAQTGCAVPNPNAMTASESGRAISVGPGETLYFGTPPSLTNAAVVDQSDGWAVLGLTGPFAIDVLARVTSIDLRDTAFPVGGAARTMVGHMTATLLRVSHDHYEVLVFRSMCQTAIHDLTRAMSAVQARSLL